MVLGMNDCSNISNVYISISRKFAHSKMASEIVKNEWMAILEDPFVERMMERGVFRTDDPAGIFRIFYWYGVKTLNENKRTIERKDNKLALLQEEITSGNRGGPLTDGGRKVYEDRIKMLESELVKSESKVFQENFYKRFCDELLTDNANLKEAIRNGDHLKRYGYNIIAEIIVKNTLQYFHANVITKFIS
jgi:hypothetical protein